MTYHRQAPLPADFMARKKSEIDRPEGTCIWCGEGDLDKMKNGKVHPHRLWHEKCKGRYYFLTSQSVARWYIEKRDKGICAGCGKDCSAVWEINPNQKYRSDTHTLVSDSCWEMDHIKPLWKSTGLTDEERLKFFEMENLQTICIPCHRKKSAQEAAERAQLSKEATG